VADTLNRRVLVYNLNSDGTLASHAPVAVLGQTLFTTNTQATTQSGFNMPTSMVFDGVNNRLFVVDQGANRVLVFDTTTITNGENAVNVLGQANFTSGTGATTQAGLNGPFGIAYDSAGQRLFVGQGGSANRVSVFDVASITNGENAVNVLGQTTFTGSGSGTTQSTFSNVQGLAYDENGQRLFVSDVLNNRVMVFDVAAITDGENAVNILGQTLYTTSTAATTQAGLNANTRLAYDSATSFLYVSQGFPAYRISVFDVTAITNGENAINVLGQANFTSSGAATTAAGLGGPYDLAIMASRLFVADAFNYRVVAYDVAAITNGEAAVDALGQSDGTSVTDPQPVYTTARSNDLPNSWSFSDVKYSALDSVHHRYFVTDRNNRRVLVFNLDSDNQFVDKVPDYVLCQPNFYTTASAITATGCNDPTGIAYDSTTNRLFVADRNGNRVVVYDVATITNGEAAVNVLGQADLTSNNNATTQNTFYNVIDVALDSAGQRLFVVDSGNNRIMVFDVTSITNGENAVNVLGKPNFTTATYDTTQAGLSGPFGVEFDSVNNRLFVGDYVNARVLVFDTTSITNGENAVNVLGQPDFTTTQYTVGANKIQYPQGMAYDTDRNYLFVADTDSRRVMVFDVASITNGENAINVLGQEDFDTQTNFGVSQYYLGNVSSVEYDNASKTLYAVGENRIVTFDVATASFSKSTTTQSVTVGTPDTFTVSLTGQPTTDVVITVTSSDPTAATVSPSSLTFTSSNWNTPQTVTTTAITGGNSLTITLSVNDAQSDNAFDAVADQTITLTTVVNPSAAPTPTSSGGGGSGGSYIPNPTTPNAPNPTPVVPATPAVPSTPNAPESPSAPTQPGQTPPAVCTKPGYPTSFIRFGRTNNSEQVKLLQSFLNLFEKANLAVDGVYKQADRQAVITFQEKYAQDILAPWKLTRGTGNVFTKTLAKMIQLAEGYCATN
jgi:DNA-binding beta-propeller fold protein YncE